MSDQANPAIPKLALALHLTAGKNHNVGEGHARAICQNPQSHEPRAEQMLQILDLIFQKEAEEAVKSAELPV